MTHSKISKVYKILKTLYFFNISYFFYTTEEKKINNLIFFFAQGGLDDYI